MSESKITTCKKCGKKIAYKTKPPMKCAECKATKIKTPKAKPIKPRAKARTKRRFPKNKNTKGELYLFAILNKILPTYAYINHGYYSMLTSPKGGQMQLDRYYPDLKLAFEYDGSQHDTYTPFIHKTMTNFTYMQQCDVLKDKLCKDLGITLIRVSYKHKVTDDAIKMDIKKQDAELYKTLFGGR